MATRGIRNNNPGNIRKGTKWQGLDSTKFDSAFCTFTTMAYGCRALMKTLRTYVVKYHLLTVKDIISRWAPPNENDTTAYINFVCKELDVAPNHRLDFTDSDLYIKLGKAIASFENGKDANMISNLDWIEGLKLI